MIAALLAFASSAAAFPPAATAACYGQTPMAVTPAPPKAETIGGRAVLRFIPPHPKGIIYLFHGTGGSERFATRPQTVRALAPLVAAGYGYVAAPSLDRAEAVRWRVDSADPAANSDIAYMLALHHSLIETSEIDAKTPVFTMGMSNGGAFANLFGVVAKRQGLPVKAVADYMGPFLPPVRALATDPRLYPPTLVVTADHDGYVDPARVEDYARALAAGGARIDLVRAVERPVCAETFAVIPGLSAADRQALVTKTLPEAGLIDAAGRRTAFRDTQAITPDNMAEVHRRLAALPQGREIANLLFVAWAAHEMRSDYADRQLRFFDAALLAT